ncbi:phage/plasmid primase, P4 family [Methanosarcina mazei]|uniref:SF3 helicase domain-containing protein n=1 Tax=Methanosarcina mazei TaxID=2209 RepID=A0A4P8QXV9_METMZ|nr:phage/plasmid primase, P4 family [Methanosarcina mazei]QCR16562.1 hypothetical protein DKM28_11585 [Methanosarcina mazei]
MSLSSGNTDPEEFKKFHQLLTKGKHDYQPFYFPLVKKGKDPLPGISWKNNRKTFSEAYSLMEKGFNIGIAGTDKDNLCIVDIDNLEAVGKAKTTLTVKSRKQIGRHCFYFTNDEPAQGEGAIFKNSAKQNIATEKAGEVRANWQYVVCSGSFVPCSEREINRIPEEDRIHAGKYRLCLVSDVSNITYEELPEIYKATLEERRATEIVANIRKIEQRQSKSWEQGKKNKSALFGLDIHDVTGRSNQPGKRFEMFAELHGSETGKNASISGDVLHCWRHNVSHNAITYLAVASGVSTCSRAGFPHGGGSSEVDIEDPYTQFTIWKYAKDHGYIPKSDPIPSKALIYCALNQKLCTKEEITDGWKLPVSIYNLVMEYCKKEGIETGRQPIKEKKREQKISEGRPEKISVPFDVVAEHILKNNHIFSMRDNRQVYLYKDGVYKSEGTEAVLDTEIRNVHNEYYVKYWNEANPGFPLTHVSKATAKYVSEVMSYIRSYTHITRDSIEENQDKYINLKNGLFNLETWELKPHTPDIKLIRQIPVFYDTDAECPQISKFLHDIVVEPDIDLLCEIAGYCLTTDCSHQKAFMLYGVGSNGKSVFLALLEALVGGENTSAESLQKLEFDKYRTAKLYGKLVNICGDIPDSKMHKSEVFKKLTSGLDLIDGENKYQDSFQFRNTAKLVFSANVLPEGKKDKAYYRRWVLVRFPNNFEGGKEDKTLITRLKDPEELSGFLNLALQGLKRLKENRKFSNDKSVEDTQREYEFNSNPIAAFMDECTKGSQEDIDAIILYSTYVLWAEVNDKRVTPFNQFGKELKKLGYENYRDNEPGKNCRKKITHWCNIEIIQEAQDRLNWKKDIEACPKYLLATDAEKMQLGQAGQALPLPQTCLVNKPYCHSCVYYTEDANIKGKNGKKVENSLTNNLDACPKMHFFDNKRVRTGSQDIHIDVPVLVQKKIISEQQNEEYSMKNLEYIMSFRADLKKFVSSSPNHSADNIPSLLDEFNRRYPGYKQVLGNQTLLDDAERLSKWGWE